jgi:hypothetical protein
MVRGMIRGVAVTRVTSTGRRVRNFILSVLVEWIEMKLCLSWESKISWLIECEDLGG